MSNRRLKNLLIYPSFQGRIIGLIAGTVVLQALVILASVYYAFSQIRNRGTSAGLSPDHPFFNFIQMQIEVVVGAVGVASVLGLVVAAFFALERSHKLVGPMYRLKKDLTQFVDSNQNQPPNFAFRKGDDFQEIPNLMNQAFNKVKGQG